MKYFNYQVTAETCKPTKYQCKIYILKDWKFKKEEEEVKHQPTPTLSDSQFAAQMQRWAINNKNCEVTCEDKKKREKEGPTNLLDDSEKPNSKCLQKTWMNAWVEFDFKGKEFEFAGIGIKSANDRPERDPKKVVISVPYEIGTGWGEIATFDIDFEEKRWHEVKYTIPPVTASKMRFDFVNAN